MQFRFFLLLPLLILFATTSCGQKTTQVSSKQILHLNLNDDPISLDPRVVRSLKDLTVVKQLFEGLTRIDQEGIPQPALAERVEVSKDLLTYTFYLREAYWNNRDPVTAYDFEYAWLKTLEPGFASDYAYMLYPIKNAQSAYEGKCNADAVGVTALNDKTLVVQLRSPTPYFLELVAFPTYYPVNRTVDVQQKQWAQPTGEHFVCNGPFCLKKWTPQTDLILERNSTYWDSAAVHLDTIVFSMIADNNTESHLFEKDELDWLGQPISQNISTDALSKLKENGSLNSYSVAGTFWLKFNTDKMPFNSSKLRKAFSYAINRQEIILHVLQGNQCTATGPVPPSIALQNGSPYFTDGNVREAKKLLEEALVENGWTLQTLPQIVLNYPPSERISKIVQLIQQQWKAALGIQVELAAMEYQLYCRNVRQGFYQVGIGDWIADFNDPLAFLELFKYRNDTETGNGMNDTGWENKTFISFLDQSLTQRDPEKRRALLNAAEKILIEEMPIAPIYHYAFDYVKKPYVKDVVLSPFGLADFKTVTLSR
jgi:oligopeptide transport system substrate-binding protein